MAQAHYEIFKDQSEQFRFRLRAPNGEIIASSEAYTRKESCHDGIEAIMRYARYAVKQDLTLGKFISVEDSAYLETYNGWTIIEIANKMVLPDPQHKTLLLAYKKRGGVPILGVDLPDLRADIDETDR